MGVDANAIVGMGFQVPYDLCRKYQDEIFDRGFDDGDIGEVRIIEDGMCGNYAYILRVDVDVDTYEGTSEHYILDTSIKDSDLTRFDEIYSLLFPDKEFDPTLIKPIFFIHYT